MDPLSIGHCIGRVKYYFENHSVVTAQRTSKAEVQARDSSGKSGNFGNSGKFCGAMPNLKKLSVQSLVSDFQNNVPLSLYSVLGCRDSWSTT